mmetsp:Transcript_17713/g.50176  ORF Transcript_17713/g.50176 Transcript_17713/m.50176 type:complete len:195 (-) Transcript_17713:64-648(-)
MLLLTQSGFALAHAACRGRQLALCGGERKVVYRLMCHGEHKWQLKGQYIAHGFSEFEESSTSSAGPAPLCPAEGPMPCSTASSVHRGFTVDLERCNGAPPNVRVHVEENFEDVSIFDLDGMQVVVRWRNAVCALNMDEALSASALLDGMRALGRRCVPAVEKLPFGGNVGWHEAWTKLCMPSNLPDFSCQWEPA